MKRLRQLMVSLILVLIALTVAMSMLFYLVSAVAHYELDRQDKFIESAETSHNLQRCRWVSDVIIKDKVMTLRCDNPVSGNHYYFFSQQILLLGDLDPTEVHFDAAKSAFESATSKTGLQITLTLYKNEPVYWITDDRYEWLIDIKSYEILWKVDKHYD
jgi:hypothetical protein